MARLERLTTNGWAVVLAVAALACGLAAARVAGRVDRDVEALEGKRRELESETRAVLARLHAKGRIVEDLLAGRLTLLEAAAEFRVLNWSRGAPARVSCRLYHRVESEQELLCREVIAWAEAEAELRDPCAALAVGQRLERQFQEHFGRGPLRFPEALGQVPVELTQD